MIYIDIDPILYGKITGVARVGLSLIHSLSLEADLVLVSDLMAGNLSDPPEVVQLRSIKKGALKELYSLEAIRKTIQETPSDPCSTNNVIAGTGIYPLWRPSKRIFQKEIGIFHDFSAITHPEKHGNETVGRFSHLILLSEKFNDGNVCVSSATQKDLKRFSTLQNSTVLQNGPSPFDFSTFRRKKLREDTSKGLQVAYLGTVEPRKRVLELLRWWDGSQYRSPSSMLTISGEVGWWANEEFREQFEDLCDRVSANVELRGYVTEESYWKTISEADLCVYPSSYEGFGFPILDALLVGTPVVSCPNSSLVEFKDFGVEYVLGDEPWNWDKHVDKALSKPLHPISDLINHFSWKNWTNYLLK
jgi:glycosyltransferase involved in cell wall biosynthesis